MQDIGRGDYSLCAIGLAHEEMILEERAKIGLVLLRDGGESLVERDH
jgi:hypothetical protein